MIVIAGGGIGGLTLGCALSQAGKPFRIFERAPELRPVGAGIALSPNAFEALAHIGIEDHVRACGCPQRRECGNRSSKVDTKRAMSHAANFLTLAGGEAADVASRARPFDQVRNSLIGSAISFDSGTKPFNTSAM